MNIEHADKVEIHLHQPRQSSGLDLSFLFRQPEPGQGVEVPGTVERTACLPPAIGEVWVGQGGIYIGIARGYDGEAAGHLVMALAEPEADVNWQAANEWAATVVADGHTDFRLPSRMESALIYANAMDKVDQSRWHWTGTQYSAGNAYFQNFSYGNQSYDYGSYEARARAVRRFPL